MIISESLLKQIIQEETEALLRENRAALWKTFWKHFKQAKKVRSPKLKTKDYKGPLEKVFDDFYKQKPDLVKQRIQAGQMDELADDFEKFYKKRARKKASGSGKGKWIDEKGAVSQEVLDDLEKAVKAATGSAKSALQEILDQTKKLSTLMPIVVKIMKQGPLAPKPAREKITKFITWFIGGGVAWLGLRSYIKSIQDLENTIGKYLGGSVVWLRTFVTALTGKQKDIFKTLKKANYAAKMDTNPELKFCDGVKKEAQGLVDAGKMTRDQAITYAKKKIKDSSFNCDKFSN